MWDDKYMKLLAVLVASLALAETTSKECPTDLQAEYFRQAWTIEHAMAKQESVVRQLRAFCATMSQEAQLVRNEDGDLRWVCGAPSAPKDKAQ